MPKNINATPDTSIWLAGTEEFESTVKVFLRAGFQPRKINEVVAYDNIMQKRKVMFEYHLFDGYLVDEERSRRFELKVSRFSYCKLQRSVVLCIYPMLSFRKVTTMLIPRGRTSFAA